MFHLVSRVALKVAAPQTAFRLMSWLGRTKPLTAAGAAAYTRRLGSSGTCLSRSISIASRLADARIAIGVMSLRDRPVSGVAGGLEGWQVMRAHAWVELDGAPLTGHEASGTIIGHLERGRRSEIGVVRQEDAGKELFR